MQDRLKQAGSASRGLRPSRRGSNRPTPGPDISGGPASMPPETPSLHACEGTGKRRFDDTDDSDIPAERSYRPRHRRRRRSNTVPVTCAAITPDESQQGCLTPRHDIRGTSGHCSTASWAKIGIESQVNPYENDDGHMRKLSGISKALSIPNFRNSSHPDDDSRPSSSPSVTGALQTSHPLLRANTTSNLPKLPTSQKRKPPASHSSYGVGTSEGPPPSYSTQQTLSQDRVVWPQERGRATKAVAPLTTSARSASPVKNTSGPGRLVQEPDNNKTVASSPISLVHLDTTHTSRPSTDSPLRPLCTVVQSDPHTLANR